MEVDQLMLSNSSASHGKGILMSWWGFFFLVERCWSRAHGRTTRSRPHQVADWACLSYRHFFLSELNLKLQSKHQLMCVQINWYISWSNDVCPDKLMCVQINWYISWSTVCPDQLLYFLINWCVSRSTDVCPDQLMYVLIKWCMSCVITSQFSDESGTLQVSSSRPELNSNNVESALCGQCFSLCGCSISALDRFPRQIPRFPWSRDEPGRWKLTLLCEWDKPQSGNYSPKYVNADLVKYIS